MKFINKEKEMNEESVGIIVTVRLQSSRIFQKAIQKIKNKTTLEILLDHVSNNRYPVIVAIPENKENDILAEIAEAKGIEVFRGNDESPLHRIVECADKYCFDHIVRITADDILIDLFILFGQIKFHLRGNHDYTFCSRCPEGVAGEVIRVDILRDVINKYGNKPIEFISYYIKNKYDTIEYYPAGYEYQFPYRLTMDYPEDLTILRILFASLREGFGTLDIINFFEQHKYFLQINRLPAITIYTCNYNTSQYILETINSVLAQNFDDYEYIIIDDFSSDNSMNLIMQYYSTLPDYYKSKIKIYRNNKNEGLTVCSNKGLEMARGKYIMRLDSDDILEPKALQTMIEAIKIYDVQGVISQYFYINEKDEGIKIEKENKFHPAGCLLAKWVVNEIKYQEDLKYLDGKPFFEKFNQDYKLKFLEEPLWNYRKHAKQKTVQKDHPDNKKL